MYTDVPIKQVIHSRLGSFVIRSRKLEHKSYSVGRGPEFLFSPTLFFFFFFNFGTILTYRPAAPLQQKRPVGNDWDNRETTICSLLIKIYRWKMSRRRVKKKKKEEKRCFLSFSLSKRFSPRFLPFETYTGFNFKLNTQSAHSLIRLIVHHVDHPFFQIAFTERQT